jgi:hypothetical protein
MHMAIRLEPQGAFSQSTSLEDLAHNLGLPTPLRHTQAASTERLLEQLELRLSYHRDLTGALQLAERAGQLRPNDRRVLLWLGYLNVLRGSQLADNYSRSEGQPYFFVAAQHLRQLRGSYGQLSDVENEWLAEALYLEAESFAVMNEKEKALNSLRESLQCGFDASRIEKRHFEPTVGADELHELLNKPR